MSTLSIFYPYFICISLRKALQSDMWVENDTDVLIYNSVYFVGFYRRAIIFLNGINRLVFCRYVPCEVGIRF